jgi:hypothetical protein
VVIRGKERSTPDLIVLGLTATVGFVVVATTCVVLYTAVSPTHEANAGEVAKQLGELTNSLIALIVGYLGGRGAAAIDAKVNPPTPPKPPPEEFPPEVEHRH